MSDDDLRVLLRSPALALEPPTGLADDVRRRARRQRTRTRAGSGIAVVALVAAGALLGPGLAGSVDDLRNSTNRAAAPKADPRAPHATTEVLTLRIINGASVITWFEGAQWCTRTSRLTTAATCLGPADARHQGFSWVLPARSPSVTVDNEHVVAGIAPPGAGRVAVHMSDGREFDGAIVEGARFPTKVWSALLVDDATTTVQYYVAYDSNGVQIGTKPA
jgi:hypothetical protein